ncbi:sigma-70 family RNA polymerase sigma factor [Aureisphaera galaxeae]|uniref:RNA polymerase sigma factor n=1 Tax=Aureisphaera galaxeae TaxID=1538023 RepID=UPI002350F609|nr:sigma-70 family RNA polymerase sigma factor [Aureisphaera galaxeae]MDC8002940.1 sigma-70 family RNA polymerase sigma factor [Aureisphaera galaxeae]
MGEVKHIDQQIALVNAIKSNDEIVLKKLYQDNYRKVEVHVLKNKGTMPQAKDIYQEAFLAMYQNIKEDKFTPKNETALQGYLFQISKNKWTDYLRSSRFKKTTQIPEGFQIKEEFSLNGQENAEQDSKKTESAIHAFKQMGNECKKLLEIFYFQKKSLREIAALFDIGEASARNKKYRCIQKLRALVLSTNS